MKTSALFEIVYSDVMGPMTPVSKGGAKYVLTFINDFSRHVFVYLLASKVLVVERFLELKTLAKTQYGKKIKYIRTDNSNKRFAMLCARSAIVHQTGTPALRSRTDWRRG